MNTIKILCLLGLCFLASCTRIKRAPLSKKDIFLFDDKTKATLIIHKPLLVKYRSCFTGKPNKTEIFKPLRKSFKDKYGFELLGLANAEGESIYVMDSSLFVKNENCIHVTGNPLTEKSMNDSISGEFSADDPRHHIH